MLLCNDDAEAANRILDMGNGKLESGPASSSNTSRLVRLFKIGDLDDPAFPFTLPPLPERL
jgi:hypothetical protein